MARALNWEKARRRELVGERGATPAFHAPVKRDGITNEQAKLLAKLQRELGVKYTGNGMSRFQANEAIKAAKDALHEAEIVATYGRFGRRVDR